MSEPKKRIAILHPFFGIYSRGAETFYMEIVRYLAPYYDITIYSLQSDETIASKVVTVDCKKGKFLSRYEKFYERHEKYRAFTMKSRYLSFLFPMSMFCKKFCKKVWRQHLSGETYDLLFPGMGSEGAKLAAKYRKMHGTPFVFVGADGISPAGKNTLFTKPDCYVAISTTQKKWAMQYTSAVEMIPNGTYIRRFQEKSEKKFQINPGHRLVLAVGNLDFHFKRQQLVIEAVSRLENVDLLILGKGEGKEELQKIAEEKMPGRCMIKGVHYTETPMYYQSADVFTLASLYEPFGIVYIEAMAAGLPVVTTDDEVRREIIQDAGIVCDVEDAKQYADCLQKAMETDWGEKPQKRAAFYDYSNIGEQYHQLFERLIQQHPFHK